MKKDKKLKIEAEVDTMDEENEKIEPKMVKKGSTISKANVLKKSIPAKRSVKMAVSKTENDDDEPKAISKSLKKKNVSGKSVKKIESEDDGVEKDEENMGDGQEWEKWFVIKGIEHGLISISH